MKKNLVQKKSKIQIFYIQEASTKECLTFLLKKIKKIKKDYKL